MYRLTISSYIKLHSCAHHLRRPVVQSEGIAFVERRHLLFAELCDPQRQVSDKCSEHHSGQQKSDQKSHLDAVHIGGARTIAGCQVGTGVATVAMVAVAVRFLHGAIESAVSVGVA